MFRTRDLRLVFPALGLAAMLLALAGPIPASAQEAAVAATDTAARRATDVAKIPNTKCLNCHDDPEMKDDAGKSLHVGTAEFALSAHKRRDCVDCHVTAGTVKHPRNALGPVAFDVCMECHEEQVTPFQGSVHAKVKGGEPESCQGCHGSIHNVVRSNDPNAPMSDVNQVRNCGACHEDMMEGYLSSVHARALFVSGLTEVSPACSDCHGSHDIQRHDAEGARTSHAKSPETCGECHKGVLKEWDESAHGVLWREGKDGPVCSTCHEAHAVRTRRRSSARTTCRPTAATATPSSTSRSTTASTASG